MREPADVLMDVLAGYAYRYTNEKELQAGIEKALAATAFDVRREVALGDAGIIDFVVRGGSGGAIGVEVKVDGSLSEVTRQLHRYAARDELSELVLVTSRGGRHRNIPATMNGKRVRVLALRGGAF